MFTKLVKIKIYDLVGKLTVHYDANLSSVNTWHPYCMIKLCQGNIGGFSISITK